MMTRKDYERAAGIVREFRRCSLTEQEQFTASNMEEAFVIFFRGDNPRFDSDRFRLACQPQDNKASHRSRTA